MVTEARIRTKRRWSDLSTRISCGMLASASSASSILLTAPGRFFHLVLDTLFRMVENGGMGRRKSFIWMGLYVLICVVYLFRRLLDPPSGESLLVLALVLAAASLLIPLALLLKRRARREMEESVCLAARDEFMRMPGSGDRPPTRFYR